MTQRMVLSGVNGVRLLDELEEDLTESSPQAVSVASAFVSKFGINALNSILEKCGTEQRRLAAGTSLMITDPDALDIAQQTGWEIRVSTEQTQTGLFHPKVIVGGNAFDDEGGIGGVSVAYIGSSNLTGCGLLSNMECGMIMRDRGCLADISTAFRGIWTSTNPLTPDFLDQYRNRRRRAVTHRPPSSFDGLIEADDVATITPERLLRRPMSRNVLPNMHEVSAAWVGLETGTGGHVQVEFPMRVGNIVREFLDNNLGQVLAHCEDGRDVPLTYNFYRNQMHRLTITTEVPGVEFAEERIGIVLIQRNEGQARISIRIIPPGPEADLIVQRSFQLNAWGRTTTRAYGWF
jgi:HKD family nuclease